MTVFNSAYETTAGKGIPITKVINAVEEVIIKENFHLDGNSGFDNSIQNNSIGYLLSNQYSSFSDIPFFIHPLVIDLSKINRTNFEVENLIITDVRALAVVDSNSNGKLIPRNKMDFNLARIKTVLNMVWLMKSPLTLRDISFVPAAVYSSWISEAISRRLALDPKDQLTLAILSCIFYYSCFIDTKDGFSDNEKSRITAATSKATRASIKDVEDVMEQIENLNNIKDFVNTIKSVLQNIRLNDFNEGMLVSIVNNSWFGSSAKETLSVALEHPPTWIAIVYSSYTERSFHNSGISKIAERYALNKGQNDFVRSVVSLVKEHLLED